MTRCDLKVNLGLQMNGGGGSRLRTMLVSLLSLQYRDFQHSCVLQNSALAHEQDRELRRNQKIP